MSCTGTKTVTQSFDRNIQPQPGPAPKVQLGKPKMFTLDNGMKVLVVENNKLPRVSVSLSIDNTPIFEGDKAGVSSLLSDLLGSGTTSVSKDDFNERIDFLGANVNYGSQSANMNSLSKFFPEIFGLMADGALNPVFTQEEFDKSKAKLIDNIKSGEKSVDNISSRVENVLAYGINHPFGEFTKIAQVEKLTLDDVKELYNTYFKPNNAYLAVIGDVKFDEVKALVEKNFNSWKKGTLPEYKLPETQNVPLTEINFIDMPEASQTQVDVISTTKLEMSNPDYYAVLVANQIFGGDFNSHLNMNLREAHGFTYGARSSVPPSKYVSLFKAGAKVRNQVVDSVVVEIMKEMDRMYTEKVSEEELKTVKASYSGNFVMQVEKPETVARYALNIQKNNLPDNFYETFLEKINAVTADDVMRVSKKYFNKDNTRIVVTSKGVDAIPLLEKLGYKINYFDKEGNVATKPKMPEAVSNDITPESVLNKYFQAIGGKAKLEAINSIEQTYEFNMQGMTIQNAYKMLKPNKINVQTIVMGQSYGKMVFDGETGYMEQMGAKMPLPQEQLIELKAKKGIIDELYLLENNTVKLEGKVSVNGADAYKLSVESNGNKSFKFFDVNSGLMIKEEKFAKGPDGKEMTVYTNFMDYKPVNGILISHKVSTNMMGMDTEMNIKNIEINKVFPEDTFK
jgi:predicted Zn-dependent peptidase